MHKGVAIPTSSLGQSLEFYPSTDYLQVEKHHLEKRGQRAAATLQARGSSGHAKRFVPSSRRIMNFLNSGIPMGRYWGITVRLHFTFLIFAFYQVWQSENLFAGFLFIAGIYFCILLHEFGHAFAARWSDGEAEDILLWPLGGLAYCRPAWHPTAHLISTVAGPLVTLVLWLVLAGLAWVSEHIPALPPLVQEFLWLLSGYNLFLLLFNLIPAFPMDGGRILRDTLWHWMRPETATRIAVVVSRVIAVVGAVIAVSMQRYWWLALPVFIFMQTLQEEHIVACEAAGTYGFSLRERLTRARRQRAFRSGVRDLDRLETTDAFHRCATCGKTEHDSPTLDFRVCSDCAEGQEYCPEHLPDHRHI
jgi:Zn-dependent protease